MKIYYSCPASLLSVVSKVFEKLVNIRIVDHLEKCGLLSDFQYGFMVIVFLKLHLIEFLGLITSLGLPELQHVIYLRFLTGFDMLVFFTNLYLMEFQIRYLVLFRLFSVINGFGWFWMGSLHKNIQLLPEFLKGPFFVLYFSCYTLMTFLMMLSIILLSMLMILLSNLSVIRHLIYSNN